jgi:dinuclear metal center YbgI/SA1388 family protein
LLLEPYRARRIQTVLLTIDLTEAVMSEAIQQKADLIIAYHPPIFSPLKSLIKADVKSRILLQAMDRGLAIYSPHTALDSIQGGVNDWLASGLGAGTSSPIHPHSDDPECGAGRLAELDHPVGLTTLRKRIAEHLGLKQVRVAIGNPKRKISRVALCAGAGGSVLEGVEADVYWTGEMRHHDVLAATAEGRDVILCEHTNTERGYLKHYRKFIRTLCGKDVRVLLSKRDRDPLEIH